jgi:hypothetical protein
VHTSSGVGYSASPASSAPRLSRFPSALDDAGDDDAADGAGMGGDADEEESSAADDEDAASSSPPALSLSLDVAVAVRDPKRFDETKRNPVPNQVEDGGEAADEDDDADAVGADVGEAGDEEARGGEGMGC